jgi:hypothetical protein
MIYPTVKLNIENRRNALAFANPTASPRYRRRRRFLLSFYETAAAAGLE